jgi:hypothetical protein
MIKPLEYWKQNAEEDYFGTPISVLRYISELEKAIENPKQKDKGFAIDKMVRVTACHYGHEFNIGEIVRIKSYILAEPEDKSSTQWLCTNGVAEWYLSENEGECV